MCINCRKRTAPSKTHRKPKIELNNQQAFITVNSNEAIEDAAVKSVKNLGYNVITTKASYPVLGMTCASCASSAENIVKMNLVSLMLL